MLWTSILPALLLSGTVEAAGRSIAHAGKRHVEFAAKRLKPPVIDEDFQSHPVVDRAEKSHKYLNANTTSKHCLYFAVRKASKSNVSSPPEFAVDGKGIPDVDFDVGESYAGLLPISSKPKEESNLFFWFFPSTNPAANKEILIWLNGGVSFPGVKHPLWQSY